MRRYEAGYAGNDAWKLCSLSAASLDKLYVPYLAPPTATGRWEHTLHSMVLLMDGRPLTTTLGRSW